MGVACRIHHDDGDPHLNIGIDRDIAIHDVDNDGEVGRASNFTKLQRIPVERGALGPHIAAFEVVVGSVDVVALHVVGIRQFKLEQQSRTVILRTVS